MRQTKRLIGDEHWAGIAPHLPAHPPSSAGGRPAAPTASAWRASSGCSAPEPLAGHARRPPLRQHLSFIKLALLRF